MEVDDETSRTVRGSPLDPSSAILADKRPDVGGCPLTSIGSDADAAARGWTLERIYSRDPRGSTDTRGDEGPKIVALAGRVLILRP